MIVIPGGEKNIWIVRVVVLSQYRIVLFRNAVTLLRSA